MNERLKKLRLTLGLSQRELAKLLGIGERTLRNYEKNADIPSSIIIKIQNLFNVNPNWLLTGEGNMFIEKEQTQNERNNEEDEKEKHIKELAEYLKTQDIEDIKQLKEFIKRWVLKTQTSSKA